MTGRREGGGRQRNGVFRSASVSRENRNTEEKKGECTGKCKPSGAFSVFPLYRVVAHTVLPIRPSGQERAAIMFVIHTAEQALVHGICAMLSACRLHQRGRSETLIIYIFLCIPTVWGRRGPSRRQRISARFFLKNDDGGKGS